VFVRLIEVQICVNA